MLKIDGPDILAKAAEANALTWVFDTNEETDLDVRYDFHLGPPATSESVAPKVTFDLPSHVLITVPAWPIIVN